LPSYVRNLAQPAGAHLSDLDMEDVFGEWHDRAVFLAQCLAGSMKNSKSLAAARLRTILAAYSYCLKWHGGSTTMAVAMWDHGFAAVWDLGTEHAG